MNSADDLRSEALTLLQAEDDVALRQLVLEHPAVLGSRSSEYDGRRTLLHNACERGAVTQARMLLELGSDPSDRSGRWLVDTGPDEGYYSEGYTAMMFAARYGHTAIVNLLIEYGGSVTDLDANRGTALLGAAVGDHVEVMNVLLAHGAEIGGQCDMTLQDEELGWYIVGTPMHAAAGQGNVSAIRCLLGHGAPLSPSSYLCGRTPLFYAAARGKHGVVDVLLKAGADPNQRMTGEMLGVSGLDLTPLHYAARNGHVLVVQSLLHAGADPQALVTYQGNSAADMARDAGHAKVLEVLESRRTSSRADRST